MKALYITLAAIFAAAGIGLLVWKNPQFFSSNIAPAINKTKNFANRTWGGIRNAGARTGNDMLHTENEPNASAPSQS